MMRGTKTRTVSAIRTWCSTAHEQPHRRQPAPIAIVRIRNTQATAEHNAFRLLLCRLSAHRSSTGEWSRLSDYSTKSTNATMSIDGVCMPWARVWVAGPRVRWQRILPGCIAACVPIKASIDPNLVDVERLKDTPMWIFSEICERDSFAGAASLDRIDLECLLCYDSAIDVNDGLRASMHLARALRRRGARNVLFTAYPTTPDSDSMKGDTDSDQVKRSYTYDNPQLYEWLLQQSVPLIDV